MAAREAVARAYLVHEGANAVEHGEHRVCKEGVENHVGIRIQAAHVPEQPHEAVGLFSVDADGGEDVEHLPLAKLADARDR
jgi:hypothetical protein